MNLSCLEVFSSFCYLHIPVFQGELEKLNQATDDINRCETELEVSRSSQILPLFQHQNIKGRIWISQTLLVCFYERKAAVMEVQAVTWIDGGLRL